MAAVSFSDTSTNLLTKYTSQKTALFNERYVFKFEVFTAGSNIEYYLLGCDVDKILPDYTVPHPT
jgi:hypothetical protein